MTTPKTMCRSFRQVKIEDGADLARSGPGRARMCRGVERASPQHSGVLDGNAFYRRHTEGMLRRYVRMSMQIGRVPSCLPREYLRTRSSFRQGANFEDGVIFVHDMEGCLAKLDKFALELVARIGIQEYSRREAAEMLGMSYGQLARNYDEAIDQLTEILLLRQLIRQGGEEYQQQAHA
jgi:hypothetical protein